MLILRGVLELVDDCLDNHSLAELHLAAQQFALLFNDQGEFEAQNS